MGGWKMEKTTFTSEQLKKLKEAYASGILKVQLNETQMQYQDSGQLLKAIRTIEKELRTKKKPMSVVSKFNKGL
jgi:hypothetical protein